MKYIVCIFLCLGFLYGCIQKGEFTITGKLPIDGYDGRYVYLCELDNSLVDYINIDSVRIKGDLFTFSGTAPDNLIGRYIFIGKKGENRINHPALLFIPEEGNIRMELNKNLYPSISGTSKNEILQKALTLQEKVDSMLERYNAEFMMSVIDGIEMPQMSEELLVLGKEQSEKMYDYLKSIRGSSLYDELLLKYISGQDDVNKKNELLSYAGQRYKNRIKWYNEIINNK